MMYKWRASLFTLLMVGALGLIFLTTGLAFADPPAGTISYWKLDEDPAPAAYTDSVGSNDGDPAAAPAPAPGRVPIPTLAVPNTAQLFDGINDGIDVPADTSFDLAADGSFTLEFWMQPAAVGPTEAVVGRTHTGVADDGLYIWVGIRNTGFMNFVLVPEDGLAGIGGGAVIGTYTLVADLNALALTDGQWYHVAAVRDNATGKNLVYIDGILEGELTVDYTGTAGFSSATAADLNIGNLDGSFFFNGAVDEVALYNRALDATEILEHINANNNGDGIDTLVAPPVVVPPSSKGGGGGGGCFIATSVR